MRNSARSRLRILREEFPAQQRDAVYEEDMKSPPAQEWQEIKRGYRCGSCGERVPYKSEKVCPGCGRPLAFPSRGAHKDPME